MYPAPMARELQPTEHDRAWMADAACQNNDAFIKGLGAICRAICRTCPVISECLDYSLVFEEYGVWGGLSERQRRSKYPAAIRDSLREDYMDARY